jgi:hypothetical protein
MLRFSCVFSSVKGIEPVQGRPGVGFDSRAAVRRSPRPVCPRRPSPANFSGRPIGAFEIHAGSLPHARARSPVDGKPEMRRDDIPGGAGKRSVIDEPAVRGVEAAGRVAERAVEALRRTPRVSAKRPRGRSLSRMAPPPGRHPKSSPPASSGGDRDFDGIAQAQAHGVAGKSLGHEVAVERVPVVSFST